MNRNTSGLSKVRFKGLLFFTILTLSFASLTGCLFDDDKEVSPYEMKRATDYGPIPFLAEVNVWAIEDSIENKKFEDISYRIVLGVDRSDLKVFINEIPVFYTSIEDMHYDNITKGQLKGDDFSADLFFTRNDKILWQRQLAIPLSQLFSITYNDTILYSDDDTQLSGGVFHSFIDSIVNFNQNPNFGRTKWFLSGGATPSESPAGELPDSASFVFVKTDNLNAAVAWVNGEIWDNTRAQYGEVIQYTATISRRKYVNLDRWD